MKYPKTRILLTIAFSVALFVIGLFRYGQFIDLLLPKVKGGYYRVTKLGSSFGTTLLFSLILGLLPISLHLLWRFTQTASVNKKLISIIIITGTMALAIIFRQLMLKAYFTNLLHNSSANALSVGYPLNKIHFDFYLFLGLCVGTCISFFMLRQKK